MSFRPKGPEGKISTKNDWELCYLRHAYLRRVDFNPTSEQLSSYENVISYSAKGTYFTYRNLFCCVGLDLDDLTNIARVHLVSFLGLFALEIHPEKLEDFKSIFYIKKGRYPEPNDILDKNKANLTLFLKQRMEDLIRTCKQKSRNIRGFPQEEYSVFEGPTPITETIDFLKEYAEYGFKKIDHREFRAIKNKVKPANPWSFKYKDVYYVAIKNDSRVLSFEDLSGADLDQRDTYHYMSPDTVLLLLEDVNFWDEKESEFNSYGPNRKNRVLKRFIKENAGKAAFSQELETARKMLKEIRL